MERQESSLSLSSTLIWQFYYEERWVVEKWNLSRSLFSLPYPQLSLALFFLVSSISLLKSSSLFFTISHLNEKRRALIFHPLLDDYSFIFQLPMIPPLLPFFLLFYSQFHSYSPFICLRYLSTSTTTSTNFR